PMFCKDQPQFRVPRADDDDAGLKPRISTAVGPDIEAMALPLKLGHRQKRFQGPNRLARDDLHAVETGPEGSQTWDRPLRPKWHGIHRRRSPCLRYDPALRPPRLRAVHKSCR